MLVHVPVLIHTSTRCRKGVRKWDNTKALWKLPDHHQLLPRLLGNQTLLFNCSPVSSWSCYSLITGTMKGPNALWDTIRQRLNKSSGFCSCSTISHSKWFNCILLLWQCNLEVWVSVCRPNQAVVRELKECFCVFYSFNHARGLIGYKWPTSSGISTSAFHYICTETKIALEA